MADKDSKLAPGVEMTRPTSQMDLERRLDEGFLPEGARRNNTEDEVLNPEVVVAPYKVEGNDTSGYLGVSSEYMTYANETEKPLTATEGPEAESLKLAQAGVAGVRKFKGVDNTPATEVGVGAAETLNTAVSGEGFSAALVDAPKDEVHSFVAGVEGPSGSQSTQTVTPAAVSTPGPATKTGTGQSRKSS